MISASLKHINLAPYGFLQRAVSWLESELDVGIFYTALELRFAFESILIKHGFASTNPTKAFEKLKSQPDKLYHSLQQEFIERLDIAKSYRFFLDSPGESPTMGYYLSVPEDMFPLYGKLDNYLHAQWGIPIGTPDKRWYKEQRVFLLDFANRLIPHTNPNDSLDYSSIPNIRFAEVNSGELESMLREF